LVFKATFFWDEAVTEIVGRFFRQFILELFLPDPIIILQQAQLFTWQ